MRTLALCLLLLWTAQAEARPSLADLRKASARSAAYADSVTGVADSVWYRPFAPLAPLGAAAFPPAGYCVNGGCPLIRFAFTAPGDIHADISTWPEDVALPVTTCKAYRFAVVDEAGLRFFMDAWADTSGGLKHPRPFGQPDTVYAIGPPPSMPLNPVTYSYRLQGQDSSGNWNEKGNAVAVAQVGPVSADSCCGLALPQRTSMRNPGWHPDRPIGPLVFKPDWRASYASFSLGVADSDAVSIETTSQTQRRVRATVCGWPWQRTWPIGGVQVACE